MDREALAFLESSKEFDTLALARSTWKAIELVTPRSSVVASSQECNLQVQAYARAIYSSLEAGNIGIIAAVDAISFLDSFNETTPAEKREFLEHIKAVTTQGYTKALEAKQGFVEVGITVNNLLKKLKLENEEEETGECTEITAIDGIKRPFTEVKFELKKGIHDLEDLSDMLFKLAAWWDEMIMETASQLQREQQLINNLDKVDKNRIRAVEQKWKNHKFRYEAYIREIRLVWQDHYSELFKAPAPSACQAIYTESYSPTNSNDEKAGYPSVSASPRNDSTSHSLLPDTYPSSITNAGAAPHQVDAPPPPPTYEDLSTPFGPSGLVLSHKTPSSSHISASFETVQILEKNKCLIILRFQCHTSVGRRFHRMTLKWSLRRIHGAHPPLILDVAPRQSITIKNEVNHSQKAGINIPASMTGVAAGFEASTQAQIKQKSAVSIASSIRGREQDSAEWLIEENTMSGIPSQFCVAAVIHYGGPFTMVLEVIANTMKGWSRRSIRSKEDTYIDVDTLQSRYEPYKTPSNWKQWFPLISGKVNGYNDDEDQDSSKANKLLSTQHGVPSKMLISHSLPSSTAHISAHLAMVQVLPKGRCFLRLDIQCIPSLGNRIDYVNIKWHFVGSVKNTNSTAPTIIQVAPKQSIGARSEESREKKYGMDMPVQINAMGATFGPQFTADLCVVRKVERAMVMTGFIQGNKMAEWRVQENTSAMSGVPSHFCVGAVVQYSSVIGMKLELHAAQRVEKSGLWLLLSQSQEEALDAMMETELDVDSIQEDYEPEDPPEKWREWFPRINGSVEGYNLSHSQAPLSSG